MKTIKKLNLIFIIVFSAYTSFAQNNGDHLKAKNGNIGSKESIKPLRLGVKNGIPNVLSLHAEYVTPLLDNRVAATADFNPFKFNIESLEMNFNNLEIGANIYLNNTGKGLYGGISYAKFNASIFNPDVEFDDGTFGPGTASVAFNTINTKLGVKFGRTFYFRLEVGYGFGTLPNQFVTVSENGNSAQVEPIEDISILGNSGLPLFNFGIGFGFL